LRSTRPAPKVPALGHHNDDRVHCAVPAIYTDGSELDTIIKANIDVVVARAGLSAVLHQEAP
jgi:hypothetical protein